MKLIHCLQCHDTIGLLPEPSPSRTCVCGKSYGHYTSPTSNEVTVYGPCKVIGFGNTDLAFALQGKTAHLTAFIIPDTARTITHMEVSHKH